MIWLRRAFVLPIRFYRRFVSPLTPPTCRFRPTCSAYGERAILVHGIVKGTLLTVWRILHCHPFAEGGRDPVPPARALALATSRSQRVNAVASLQSPAARGIFRAMSARFAVSVLLVDLGLVLAACASRPAEGAPERDSDGAREAAAPGRPFPGARPADELIDAGEEHFAHLWMLTEDGENAEAYWSSSGDSLVFQRRAPALGIECDRIFLYRPGAAGPVQLSDGVGVTTCAYFLPGDRRVLFASTRADAKDCPPPIDPTEYRRLGYFWRVFPEYEVWVKDLASGELTRLTESFGYDAEATVSPRGDRIVFTSSRSGDLELWTCDLEGKDLRQVTHSPGYDGGAFFSHDGTKLVFRNQVFDPAKPAEDEAFHRDLLTQWKVNPKRMELALANADGSERRAIRELGGANFAPYFFPGDARVIFSSNHHDPAEPKREFDLFAIGVDGEGLERITTAKGFDSFPMFSPDGRYLVFASNRGARVPGDTNLFLAEWR